MTPLRALATIAAFIIETVAVCYIITVVVVAAVDEIVALVVRMWTNF